MPSHAEIILARVTTFVSLAFKIVFLASRLYGYAEYYWYVSSVNDFNVLWRVSTNAWALLLALSIVCWFIHRMVSGTRIAKLNAARTAAGAVEPDVFEALGPSSVLGLSWAMDYNSSVRSNITRTFLQPGAWLSFCFVGVFCMLVDACDYTQGTILEPSGMIDFFFGSFAGIVFRMIMIYDDQRKLFPNRDASRHEAVILDLDGLRWIDGQTEQVNAWVHINAIREAGGIVSYESSGLLRLIPRSAFQLNGDGKVFAATMRALKKGQLPPPYDWSAYAAVEPSSEGVWPPPIR